MIANRPSYFWRWASVILLAISAYPIIGSLRAVENRPLAVSAGESWDVPGEIVVQLRNPMQSDALPGFAGGLGLGISAEMIGDSGRILDLHADSLAIPSLLNRLKNDSNVEFAEPQHLFRAYWKPNDPRYAEQWNFQRIHMEKAWDVTRGKGAVVAVIDTGVAFEKDNKCYRARDFDRTKFKDPYDFIFRDKHPTDDHGHGTHVAGTIAESTDNGEGVAGIAFESTVMPLKVLSKEGYGRMSDVAAAIRYAADHGANVINMSLGAPMSDSITRSACKYAFDKGCVIVCAAGNSGSEGVGYPAAYPECIAVSALGPTGELAPYSSWGKPVAISAPGGDKSRGENAGILQNTYLRRSDSGGQEDGYFSFQGTSMASPHVAGVAALVVSQGVKEPTEVKAILQKSAQKRGAKEKYGAGELDAAAAVKLAKGDNQSHYERLALVGGFWLIALAFGRGKRRFATPLALTIGLLLPDAIAMFAGFGSTWNLLGHSVLIPGYLLIAEAESPTERRFYAVIAAGIAVHIGADLWLGLGPLIGSDVNAVIPWLWANAAIGTGALLSSLIRR